MAFFKLLFIGLAGLSVIYLSLSVYSASVRRERLEKEYDAAPDGSVTRDDHVAAGMKAYKSSLRPKLLVLVYVLPAIALAATVYVVNAN